MKKRRLLFLKAVAYDSMNQEIRDYLEPFLDEKTDLEVRSIAKGTSHMEYHFYQAVNQGEILRGILQAEKDGFDACIISCFDDPCLYEGREIARNIIVAAPGEACAHLAATLGNKFSVIVGRKKWIPQMEENIHKYGLGRKLASFRSLDLGVLEFHENEDETRRRMEEEIRRAVEEDQAEVIILGCTMQFGFYREMQEKFQIPVIDSMVASVKYAEYLVEMKEKAGWTFSRSGLYERPPEKEMQAWELEKICDMEGLLYGEEGKR